MLRKENKLVKNTFYLYIMTAAKLILPLITLPYLTRVLSTEAYGTVVYVKSCMSYVQLIIDFGFILSATKDVVEVLERNNDTNIALGRVLGDTIAAKALLALGSVTFIAILSIFIPMLQHNLLFLWLYLLSYIITIFLSDFLFRGLEKMGMVSIPYTISKTLSTALTLFCVKDDATMIYIPILEIVGNLVAVVITMTYIRKIGIVISFSDIKIWITKIKESFVYFISSFATTAFGALNTMLVGIFLSAADVAYWGVAMQLNSAVQQMYSPIMNSLYPYMLKKRSKVVIKNTLLIFMPIIILGCVLCEVIAKWIILIVSGEGYLEAIPVFRALVPVLFISFPAMLFGWPVLGAIKKAKETTISTISAALVQVGLIVLLALIGKFSLINLAICRSISEFSMLVVRYAYYRKYRCLFLEERT